LAPSTYEEYRCNMPDTYKDCDRVKFALGAVAPNTDIEDPGQFTLILDREAVAQVVHEAPAQSRRVVNGECLIL
jgi:hypothetical protein